MSPKMRTLITGAAALLATLLLGGLAHASEAEALKSLPNLGNDAVKFFGMTGQALLTIGLLICLGGGAFGLVIYRQLKNMPVHSSMKEISELIYETCKTYLFTQIRFIGILGAFIGWHQGNLHWNVGTMINVPVGVWNTGRLANIGFNHWAFDFTGAVTWLDPTMGLELSAAAAEQGSAVPVLRRRLSLRCSPWPGLRRSSRTG